jgi:hypothetical protein
VKDGGEGDGKLDGSDWSRDLGNLRFTLRSETGLIWVCGSGMLIVNDWDNKRSVFATASSFIPRVG